MLDSTIRPIIDPPLNKVATLFKQSNITGTHITLAGFGFGLASCAMMFTGDYMIALGLLILNRLCDGLDGAVARARGESSDFGGYLDIMLDFIIYALFPFAAGLGIGTMESITVSAFILFSIIGTGVSFLAYAIICAKRGLETSHQGKKTFYFSNGLMEGTETIIVMMLMCLLPQYFIMIGTIFGVLCVITTAMRIRMAYHVFV